MLITKVTNAEQLLCETVYIYSYKTMAYDVRVVFCCAEQLRRLR
jgi:hypothetical protein